MILAIIIVILGFIAAIFFHELAHAIILGEFRNKHISIRLEGWDLVTGEHIDYKLLKHWQFQTVIAAGIIAGFLPLMIIVSYISNPLWRILIMVIYLFGCKNDIAIMGKRLKNEHLRNKPPYNIHRKYS